MRPASSSRVEYKGGACGGSEDYTAVDGDEREQLDWAHDARTVGWSTLLETSWGRAE